MRVCVCVCRFAHLNFRFAHSMEWVKIIIKFKEMFGSRICVHSVHRLVAAHLLWYSLRHRRRVSMYEIHIVYLCTIDSLGFSRSYSLAPTIYFFALRSTMGDRCVDYHIKIILIFSSTFVCVSSTFFLRFEWAHRHTHTQTEKLYYHVLTRAHYLSYLFEI